MFFCMMSVSSLTVIISSIVMVLASLLSKKTIMDREKNSPYECGFDAKGSARIPFSLRSFLFAVIFLIFDVDITLLLPIASIMTLSALTSWLFTSVTFLFILLLGLYYESYQGALQWSD